MADSTGISCQQLPLLLWDEETRHRSTETLLTLERKKKKNRTHTFVWTV